MSVSWSRAIARGVLLTTGGRPLVALLEDLGVHKDVFLSLQEDAKRDTVTASDRIVDTVELLRKHDLGGVFGLRSTLQYLDIVGMGARKDEGKTHLLNNDFIKRVVKAAQTYILREFKHEARIPIPDANQLVGVVDEGPAWEGVKNVFCLEEGQIFGASSQTRFAGQVLMS